MSTDAPQIASGDRKGGRAGRPGPRVIQVAAAVIALLVAAVAVIAIKPGGPTTGSLAAGHLQTSSVYGKVPSWDRIPEAPAVKAVIATPRHPDLKAMEGYPVDARFSGGAVRYFAEGPSVPDWVASQASDGQLKEGESVPSTFEVTFTGATGTVPLAADDFTVITYNGKLLHPTVTNASGGALPATVAPAQTVRLKLMTSLPEGDGEIRWAPVGGRILVSYFWTLEFD